MKPQPMPSSPAPMRASILALALLAAPAAATPPEIHIAPRTWQGVAFAGLTRLGETPLTTPVPAFEIPLTVFAPGLFPAEKVARLRPGSQVDWLPVLRPPMPPPPAHWPDGGPAWLDTRCARGCGLGASDHFSPPLAQSLARARALTEAARSQEVRIVGLGHTYDEDLGVGRRLTTRQETETRIRLGRLLDVPWGGQRFARAELGRGDGAATALGAADATGDASPAAARLAALVGALRWSLAQRAGVEVRAVSRTWGDDMITAALVEEIRELRLAGRLAGLELVATTHDAESLARRTDGSAPIHARYADEVSLRAGALEIGVADGVLVRVTGAADAEAALAVVQQALEASGRTVHFATAPPVRGVVVVEARLGAPVSPPQAASR